MCCAASGCRAGRGRGRAAGDSWSRGGIHPHTPEGVDRLTRGMKVAVIPVIVRLGEFDAIGLAWIERRAAPVAFVESNRMPFSAFIDPPHGVAHEDADGPRVEVMATLADDDFMGDRLIALGQGRRWRL